MFTTDGCNLRTLTIKTTSRFRSTRIQGSFPNNYCINSLVLSDKICYFIQASGIFAEHPIVKILTVPIRIPNFEGDPSDGCCNKI